MIKVKIKGTFLQGGVENGNGRIYSEETIVKMVEQFNDKNKPLFGYLGNSDDALVHLSSVSHKVNKIKIQYKKLSRKKKKEFKKLGIYNSWRKSSCSLVGEIELLNTEKGRLAKKLLDNLVVRPSGIGTLNNDGTIDNYQLTSFNLINKDEDSFKGIIK